MKAQLTKASIIAGKTVFLPPSHHTLTSVLSCAGAPGRMVGCMERNRKMPASPRATPNPAAFELPPDRAFVLQLATYARLPRRVVGRVEHVTSGQVAHVTCLRELVAFMAKVLRDQVRGERGTVYATRVQEPCQTEITSSVRGLDAGTSRLEEQPTFLVRKRGTDS